MVAVANTVVGILYAAAAVLGLMADKVGVPAVLGVLGGMAVLGTLMSWRLPEAGELFRRVEEG